MPYHQPANCLSVRKVPLPCTNPILDTGKDPRSQASGGLDAVNTDMHNRMHMVVGSFLPKNLGIHWRLGEEWFWDTLLDALSAPPIADLKESRQAALDAYAEIKDSAGNKSRRQRSTMG